MYSILHIVKICIYIYICTYIVIYNIHHIFYTLYIYIMNIICCCTVLVHVLPFSPVGIVCMAQEIVRCAQVVTVLTLWLVVAFNSVLQVISRIAKGDKLVSFCITFSPLYFLVGCHVKPPCAPCPERERRGCIATGKPYTTGGSGNPFRCCNNRRRHELPGGGLWPMPTWSTQKHARCLRC